MTKMKMIALSLLLMLPLLVSAQSYCGEHKFDGVHKNEVTGYLVGGKNVVTGWFLGPTVSYKRHLTDRWSVEGNMQAQFGKQLYGIYVQGSYCLPVSFFNFNFNGKVMYNRYNLTRTNEYVMNLSVLMETPYFELQVGESGIRYHMLHSSYNEPMTFTFGTGVNIRPRWNSWNIGLYFRNFDEFYYENWNINWGVRFNAKLTQQLNLFGEFKVRPAGSLSQLASKYETSEKIGVKYVW